MTRFQIAFDANMNPALRTSTNMSVPGHHRVSSAESIFDFVGHSLASWCQTKWRNGVETKPDRFSGKAPTYQRTADLGSSAASFRSRQSLVTRPSRFMF